MIVRSLLRIKRTSPHFEFGSGVISPPAVHRGELREMTLMNKCHASTACTAVQILIVSKE